MSKEIKKPFLGEQQKITVDSNTALFELLSAMVSSGYKALNISVNHKKYPHDHEKYFVVRYWENEYDE